MTAEERRASLVELALLFLRLGATSFGGPAAHVGMMEREIVERRRWLGHEDFLDLLGATNLIPGPNSTELAIHIGYRRAGWPGLVVAGVSFILPATIIVATMAWGYVRFGALPEVAGVLYAVKPVVIAVVLQALWSLSRVAVKSVWLAVVAVAATAAVLAGVHEIIVLLGAGLAVALVGAARRGMHAPHHSLAFAAPLVGPLVTVVPGAAPASAAGLWAIFGVFAKVGALLFGSGYVLLAFLRADLVERYRWLTEQQLLDAVAVGQVTPGPVFTTATFIGYLLHGGAGAAVATVGIFLPAFIFVAASIPMLAQLRRSVIARTMLDGVNVASLALMAVVSWQLARSALVDAATIGIAVVSALLLLYLRVNSAWLVLIAAIAGLALRR